MAALSGIKVTLIISIFQTNWTTSFLPQALSSSNQVFAHGVRPNQHFCWELELSDKAADHLQRQGAHPVQDTSHSSPWANHMLKVFACQATAVVTHQLSVISTLSFRSEFAVSRLAVSQNWRSSFPS